MFRMQNIDNPFSNYDNDGDEGEEDLRQPISVKNVVHLTSHRPENQQM